jgi:hypothetical protein
MTFRLSRRGLTIYDKLCHALIHLVAPTPSDVSQLRVGAAARGNVTTDVNPSAHSIHKPSDVGRPEAESLVNPIRAWALAIRNVALSRATMKRIGGPIHRQNVLSQRPATRDFSLIDERR